MAPDSTEIGRRHKVFVLEKLSHQDFSKANRYGELVYLFDGREKKPGVWSMSFVDECFARMKANSYDSDLDFFVVGGNQVANTLIACYLQAHHDTVNLLLFDAKSSEYVHKAVMVGALAGGRAITAS